LLIQPKWSPLGVLKFHAPVIWHIRVKGLGLLNNNRGGIYEYWSNDQAAWGGVGPPPPPS
jgi:hypothetical protein